MFEERRTWKYRLYTNMKIYYTQVCMFFEIDGCATKLAILLLYIHCATLWPRVSDDSFNFIYVTFLCKCRLNIIVYHKHIYILFYLNFIESSLVSRFVHLWFRSLRGWIKHIRIYQRQTTKKKTKLRMRITYRLGFSLMFSIYTHSASGCTVC